MYAMGDGAGTGFGRKTTDLLELPFVFSQQPLLTPDDFIRAYQQRVTYGQRPDSWEVLAALHEAGLLVPFLRVTPDIEAFIEWEKDSEYYSISSLLDYLTSPGLVRDYIRGDRENVTIIDPRPEPFIPWLSLIKRYEGETYWSSRFFFSHYQLLLIPLLRPSVERIRFHRRDHPHSWLEASFSADFVPDEHLLSQINENTELAIVLSALETHYLPGLKGHFNKAIYSAPRPDDSEEVIRYSRHFDPKALLDWIGWGVEKIKTSAERLLWQAEIIDPLESWYELVRLCHPDQLNKLRGDALIALDHRRAAELLLRFYGRLIKADVAAPFEVLPRFARGPLETRLKGDPNDLDSVLMKFGLSPQPALLLVLEGETEAIIVPEVMGWLGIPQYNTFIRIFKGNGIDSDFKLLARFAATPAFGEALGNAVDFARPPTHFMVVLDAEQKLADAAVRDKLMRQWIGGIWHDIANEVYRTPTLQRQLANLVHFETWGEASFEFAHFTDQELAQAIIDIYPHAPPVSFEKLTEIVGTKRQQQANLEDIWKPWRERPSKGRLARQLVSILKDKIERADPDHLDKIPVVRVLRRAYDLAARIPRNNVAMLYQPPASEQ
jgi:hypothetical protein